MTPLITITIAYLALPSLIFWIGWLTTPLALALITAFGFSAYKSEIHKGINFSSIQKNHKYYSISIAIAAIWVLFVGFFGIGAQNGDWIKHNSVMHDLIFLNWPIQYTEVPWLPGIPAESPLVYYMAYYLPSALIGRLTGSNLLAETTLYLWTLTGVVLTIFWIARLLKSNNVFPATLLFIFFSGLDIAGSVLYKKPVPLGEHLEWWTSWRWQYSSMTSLLFWVPQHAIAGWLGTALCLESFQNKKLSGHWAPLLTSLWSPFVTLGLLPFWIYSAYTQRKTFFKPSWVAVFGFLQTFVICTYYSSHSGSIVAAFQPIVPDNIGVYFAFLFFEVFVFAFIFTFVEKDSWLVAPLLIALATLCVLPIYRIGIYNDLAMRASIPAIFILYLSVATGLKNTARLPQKHAIIIATTIITIGAATPVFEIIRSIKYYGNRTSPYSYLPTTPFAYPDQFEIGKQYTGDSKAFFWRYLAKKN